MLLKLLLSAPLLLFAAHLPQTQSGSGSSATMPETLPIKMGLWENTITTSQGQTEKTRSCFTKESFQRSIANLPATCKVTNQVWKSQSYSSDVACNASGSESKGHLEMQFPNTETQHSTITITITSQGKTMPLTITTESHFISADCADLLPGQSREVQ